MKIHVKQTETLIIPKDGTPQASGYDIVAIDDPKIVGVPDETNANYFKSIDYIEYHTGLFIAPQTDPYGHNYHTLIFPRSSLRKYNLLLANSIGLIDNDYRGEIILCFKYIWQPQDLWMPLAGNGKLIGKIDNARIYQKGDRIGQLVAEVTNHVDWIVVGDLSATVRGAGGFGSTDHKEAIKTLEDSGGTLLDKYKKEHDLPSHTSYEKAIREREKQMV